MMRLVALFSSIAVFLATVAAATDIRPVLPPVEYPDTEVVTNVAVLAQGSCEYAFELAFLGTASNNVEIAFGTDADGDGALSLDEIGLSVGWNCGEWFVMNAATGEIVLGKNENDRNYIASITKLLTCLTALDYLSPEENVKIETSGSSSLTVRSPSP